MLYRPEAASTKEVSLLISIACLNASSSVFLCNFSYLLHSVEVFLAYSTMTVLLYCLLGGSPNATLWITSYLWLNVTRGSVGDVCMLCNLVVASIVLGMSE